MVKDISISVIVPVYNDEKGLAATLDSLMLQTYPKEQIEIIVVDNGSTDQSVAVAQTFSGVIVLKENKPGSYAARNTGILTSSHPTLAFLDAECIAHPDWISEGIKALKKIQFDGLVGGKVIFTFQKKDNPNLIELYDSITHLKNKEYVEKDNFAVTGNMFTSKAVFDEVGLFDDELKSGGDREWGERVSRANKSVVFAEKALNYHHARSSIKQLITKTRRVISGLKIIEKNRPTVINQLIPPVKRMSTILKNKKLGHFSVRLSLVGLVYFLKLVSAFELLRLGVGYAPERK
jgi:glycosyltransferase involved in cell wall biosynthesis